MRSPHRLTPPERLEQREVPAAAPLETLPVLPDLPPETLGHVRQIALAGRAAGLRSDAFIKLGDSNTATPEFFGNLGAGRTPGPQPGVAGFTTDDVATFNRYSAPVDGSGANSFTRVSLAAKPGWTVPRLLEAVDAEVNTVRPAVALITIGTNDTAFTPYDQFRPLLAALVDRLTARGVVPVLTTMPHLQYRPPSSEATAAAYSQLVADVAAEKRVPLVNLWKALEGVPFYGLKSDFVHLTVSPNGGAALAPADLQYGQNERAAVTIRSLTVVRQQVLDYDPAAAWAAPIGWSGARPGQHLFAVGSDAGGPGEVAVYDADTRAEVGRLRPFERGFFGGVRVATGDLDGDGVADVAVAAGPGGGPVVAGFSGRDGHELFRTFAFEPGFTGGVNLAVGDVDGDGRPELVAGAGGGGGPRVRVIRASDQVVTQDFFAFEPSFRGGVNVAAGAFGIAAGAGDGCAPLVTVFDGRTLTPRAAVFAFDPSFRGGVRVAAGDLTGDGRAELVTAAGGGGAPHVRLIDPLTGADGGSFFAGDPAPLADGVRLAVPAGTGRLVVAPGRGTGPLRWFDRTGTEGVPVAPPDGLPFVPGVFVG
ncbi:MAG: SGNH/GDSL hydrolase family protein [Gemmataceae bacterium]